MNHFSVESLEIRALMSASLANGNLTIVGTDNAETINVNPANNGTQISVQIGAAAPQLFDASLVTKLTINALGGDDTVNINVNRPSDVHGGQGNDTLNGGDGDDVLTGEQGTDVLSGGLGNDTNVWNPGDGSDKFDGGDGGFDTLLFNGSSGAEVMNATANGTRFLFTRDVGTITIDNGGVEHIVVNALGGNDQVSIGNLNAAGVLFTDINGGDGNDILNGSAGFDNLVGGAGNDTIDGNGGADVMAGGDGDDLLIWDPGDGNDLDIGGNGNDTLRFNGNAADEVMTLTKSGPFNRMLFTRNVGNILLDVRTVENIDIEAGAGNDTIVVNNLTGTGITSVFANGGDGTDTLDLRNAGPTGVLTIKNNIESVLQ